MAFAQLHCVECWRRPKKTKNVDALIVIGPFDRIDDTELSEAIRGAQQSDQRIGKETLLLLQDGVPGKRLVLAPTGPLNRDYDDVRQEFSMPPLKWRRNCRRSPSGADAECGQYSGRALSERAPMQPIWVFVRRCISRWKRAKRWAK